MQLDFSSYSGFLTGRRFKVNLAEIDFLFTDQFIEFNVSGNKFLNGNVATVAMNEFIMVRILYILDYRDPYILLSHDISPFYPKLFWMFCPGFCVVVSSHVIFGIVPV